MENEEIIGTLIETNERIINSLQLYDNVSGVDAPKAEATETIGDTLARTHLTGDSEVVKLQEKQRVAVQRAKGSFRGDGPVYSDLQDIDFGSSSNNLPPPLRPSTFSPTTESSHTRDSRGSLSDFSDYESSDEETHNKYGGGGSVRKEFVNVSDDERDTRAGPSSSGRSKGVLVDVDEDPFADPFRD